MRLLLLTLQKRKETYGIIENLTTITRETTTKKTKKKREKLDARCDTVDVVSDDILSMLRLNKKT